MSSPTTHALTMLVALTTLSLCAPGCAGLGAYPSLGTYHVDGVRLVILDVEAPDTLAILGFGDTVEVIDAPPEHRTSDDLFIVRVGRTYARAERDLLMSDYLFRSKYTRGRPVLGTSSNRYYLDEFRDTVQIRWQENVTRTSKPIADDDTIITERPRSKKKRRR